MIKVGATRPVEGIHLIILTGRPCITVNKMKTFESNFDRDGVNFFVQGWEPDTQPKAVIALVHGLGEHVGRYAHVGKALTDAGYVLVGFDVRGHGKSSGARGHFPSLDAVMSDIRQFFQVISQRYSNIPQFLYGHSLGGLLALAYAVQNPKQGLKGVMVTGSGLRSALQEQKAKMAMAKILGTLVPTMTIPSGLDANTISRDKAVVDKYVNDPLVHDKTSLGLGKSALNAIDVSFAGAKDFAYPLLIMHGQADKLTYASGSQDFAKLVSEKNKDVTLKIWEGLYHEVHNEPEQAEVFKVMIEWLDRHL
jgi:alpha-beta hydrolase superfamily lysophospholipase